MGQNFRRRPGAAGQGAWRGQGGPGQRRFTQAPLMGEGQRQLAEANRLLLTGQPLDAAKIFVRVADVVAQNQAPARAARLFGRAGHAFLTGGDVASALSSLRRAFNVALASGMIRPAVQVAHFALQDLEANNRDAEAETLRTEFNAALAQVGIALTAKPGGAQPAQAHLPAQCPACLGPVRPDDVEWIDATSAECAFCGTVLRAE